MRRGQATRSALLVCITLQNPKNFRSRSAGTLSIVRFGADGVRLRGLVWVGRWGCGCFVEEREGDGEAEDDDDDGEGVEGADLEPVGGEHLEGGEGEDQGEAVVEEAELGEEMGEEEVERAEAHDGHDVGGVGEEGMGGDGEDGGDGVEGEDYVGDLDGNEADEEHGDHSGAVFDGEEAVLAHADGVDLGEPSEPTGAGVDFAGREA